MLDIDPYHFAVDSDDAFHRAGLFLCGMLIGNSPDYASIALYVAMFRRQKTKVGSQAAEVPKPDDLVDLPYGGIFVGDEVSVDDNLPGEVVIDDDLDFGPVDVEPMPPEHGHNNDNGNSSGNSNSSAKQLCSMRALKTHAATCLLDLLAIPMLGLLPVCEATLVSSYLFLGVSACWLPALATVHNFGTIRKVVRDMWAGHDT